MALCLALNQKFILNCHSFVNENEDERLVDTRVSYA